MKSKDESFEIEKIKSALEEISSMGNIHKEAEEKIHKLQMKYNELNKECDDLTKNIVKVVKNLDSLNLENHKLSKELDIIYKEVNPVKMKRTGSLEIFDQKDKNRKILDS